MPMADEGPISRAISSRPPFGPIERLEHAQLREEQQVTLRSPRRKASISARLLFLVMDRVYGEARTLDVHMSGLRRKLGNCGEGIETVIGIGYRLRQRSAAA